jgi:peptidoglycan/LPS O-acetylase OafA/YrhL
MLPMLKHPSAWIPLALSLAALAMVAGALAIYGLPDLKAPQDEGALAHIWQLLMVGQAFGILIFASLWLPRRPAPAIAVLGLQVLGVLVAAFPVWYLGL